MNEIRLNELLNKIYYEYLDSHEAEEFIIYFKRLKQDKDNLQSKIDKANEILDKYAKTEVEDYEKIIKFYKELRKILKEEKTDEETVQS